ncbi:MAG: nucleoside recognition domain protein [Firmicutes bacterium]|nr:nucleoside recognition domain protein [Bacillota bacterium]
MDISLALSDVLKMWKTALPAMFLGCYCGVVLKNRRFFTWFSKVLRPMTSLGKLPEALGPFFILCLLNRYAANAMLAEFGRNAVVNKNGIIAVYLMGSLPTGIYFTIFYFSPALIAGLGWKLGMAFMAINIGMSTLVTVIGILWNRINFRQDDASHSEHQQTFSSATADKIDLVAAARTAFWQFWDIAVVFVPVTFVFALFMHTDIINEILPGAAPVLHKVNLTAAGVLVILAGIPTMIAAIGVAGTLLQSGALVAEEIIFTLLVASFFHNVYDAVSRVLPTNVSIFGVKLGVVVTVVGTVVYLAMVALAASLAL